MMSVRKLGMSAALVGALALVGVGCKPLVFPTSKAAAATAKPCVEGNWTLDTSTLTDELPTKIPGLTVKATGSGISLNLTDTKWTLHADQKLTAALDTDFGDASGELHAVGDANGSYTSTPTEITFTLGGLSGSADYDVAAFGMHFKGTHPLEGSGLDAIYGLSGTAKATCSGNDLSLSVAGVDMHLHR